ncbi:uncharacterized protein C8A04DRAFT_12967 [Dichotomopilus funicola]|uniref:Early meiotic induction protein 1 n=1 Tax=Dichotomopilus funicola TaxID=1934379 RepID=A0AAN6V1Q5_9PEZI|nr:hypothetical protein C8A04DRAFT_12967 [Dichotomopilus funicola]
MGWFWQSSTPPPTGSNSSPSSSPTAVRTSSSATGSSSSQSPSATNQSKPTNSSDREMALFMDMFMKDAQKSSSQSNPSQNPPQPPSHPNSQSSSSSSSSWLPWASNSSTTTGPSQDHQQQHHPQEKDTRSPHSISMSEHSLPTTLSCRDAFDYAWHCHTPGSQWNAVYRYGTVRPCTELWDDFWFCMRTKSFSPEARAEAIREHYRAKETAKYGRGGPSSEDVWESREERVVEGTVFRTPFEAPAVDDDEVRRQDAEWRRARREKVERENR